MSERVPPFRHQHEPVVVSTRPRCPVCGALVYSPAGIHPQCSAKREDALQKAEKKAALTEGTATANDNSIKKNDPSLSQNYR
jgi:hypothetical protein